MATEAFANFPATTVPAGASGTLSSGQADTWQVTLGTTGFPTATTGITQFHVADTNQAASSELILVTNMSGTDNDTWSVVRGAENTGVMEHDPGFTITAVITAGWLNGVAGTTLPEATPGAVLYASGGSAATWLAGNTTATKEFLTSTGAGGTANTPVWGVIAAGDVPTLNQNTTGTALNVTGTVATTHGGTGLGSVTAYTLLTGGTSPSTPLQQVASAGTVGQVLVSQGPGVLPQWGTVPGVTFPITVPEGGTGGTSATAYAVITGGTSASAPLQAVSSGGTAGLVLTSTATLPSWQNAAGGTGGTTLVPTAVQTSAYAASVGQYVPCDTTSGSFTVTLPSAPANQSQIGVQMVTQGISGGTFYTVTVAAGGTDRFYTITGGTTQSLTTLAQSILLQYDSALSPGVWYPYVRGASVPQLDIRYDAGIGTTTWSSATESLAIGTAANWNITLNGTVTSLSFTGANNAVSQTMTLYITQGSGGPYPITWPSSVTWLGNVIPSLGGTMGALTVLTFTTNNGGVGWYGAQVTGIPIPIPDADLSAQAASTIGMFGDGSDGITTLDGSTATVWASLSGSTYTMTRDSYTTALAINGGVTLKPAGYRIFCQGIVTVVTGGTITVAGNPGSGAAGGASTGFESIGGGRAGGAGGTAAGGAGFAGLTTPSGAGGAGGSAPSGAGGTIPSSLGVPPSWYRTPFPCLTGSMFWQATSGVQNVLGGGSGGGGGGDGSNSGGGGGSGGGLIVVYAYDVVNNGTMTVAGGNGASPASGNTGGGGGGGGGAIIAYTLIPWSPGTTTYSGGGGGTGHGSGVNGASGAGGTAINIVLA